MTHAAFCGEFYHQARGLWRLHSRAKWLYIEVLQLLCEGISWFKPAVASIIVPVFQGKGVLDLEFIRRLSEVEEVVEALAR